MPIYEVWTAAGGRLGSIIAKSNELAIERAQKKYYPLAKYVDLHLFNDKLGYTWNPSGERGSLPHHPLVAERPDKRPWKEIGQHWCDTFMDAIKSRLHLTVIPCGGDEIYVNVVLDDPYLSAVTYPLCTFTYKEGEEVDMLDKIVKTLARWKE